MTQFPTLRTGAVTQYPARKISQRATHVVTFVDGAEQRARAFASPLRRWVVRLDLADEGELAAIDLFFIEQQGSVGVFSFTDPWDGVDYPNCSIDQDECAVELYGPGKCRTQIAVKENRT